jgi:hypothetical protein
MSCHCVISRFLSIEPRRACCLHFIFRQCFIPSPPSQAKTEALNPHHRGRLPSPNRLTPILHCYKKIISTLTTLRTTQPRLYFASSIARAPWHRSSTRHRRSLSPLSHSHHPSAQWLSRWWTSRPTFTSQTAYRYVNSRKKKLWNAAASRGIIN